MSMRSLSVVAVLLVVAAAAVGTDVAAADPPPSLAVVEVTATSSDGNIPENTIDGDLTTRWSAQTVDPEDPEHITWDLGEVEQLGYLGIAWHQGDLREAFYAIAVSTDGQTWQTVVADGASSGSAIDLEPVNTFVTYDDRQAAAAQAPGANRRAKPSCSKCPSNANARVTPKPANQRPGDPPTTT
jgi:hypothetical protein